MGFPALKFLKIQEKQKQKAFEKRAFAFQEKYNELVKEFRCDWEAYITVDPSSRIAQGKMRIIDASAQVKAEEKEIKEAEEKKGKT